MKLRDDTDVSRASRALALKLAALILILFALLGGVVYLIVSASQMEATDRILADAARIESPADAPPGVTIAVREGDRVLVTPKHPPGLPDMDAIRSVAESGVTLETTTDIAGHSYRVRTSANGPRVIQVAAGLEEAQEELQRLLWALIVSGTLAAIAALSISAWMARRAMQPLAEALSLQRRFVMDASHELRTPLTVLSTRAQLLRRKLKAREDPATQQLATGIDEIVQDARALGEILEDLLIAADPRESTERLSLDLAELADDAVAAFQAKAEERGISVRRTGAPGPVLAPAARVSMNRLLAALVANALDHARSEVRVDVTTEGKDAVIRVIDDGPGFPRDLREHAFDRFASARLADSGDDRQRHYGLGLALVSEVASRHGGTVGIEQGGTDGGVVVVRLPAHP